MPSVNKVILIGNLGRDPELRYTASNQAVANFSVATSEMVGKDEGRRQVTEWHSVVVWGKQAEACKRYLAKGRSVYVEGRIQSRKYQDKAGNDRTAYEIVATAVQFLGGGGNGQESAQTDSVYNGAFSQAPMTAAASAEPGKDDVPF